MELRLLSQHAAGYKNPSQIARRVTEAWAEENLFCVACNSPHLTAQAANARAVDFRCPICDAGYQLKALKAWSERKIPDAGYEAMMGAIQSDCVPNLLVMQYSLDWFVQRLLLIPSFFFSPIAIEKRKPLSPAARRAGWVGCNILLHMIAGDGKILIVDKRQVVATPEMVRHRYDKVRRLAAMPVINRGWALAVLKAVRDVQKPCFTLSDIYRFESVLAAVYPNNRNIRPKIRQQLQVLRDLGFIKFNGRGEYLLLR